MEQFYRVQKDIYLLTQRIWLARRNDRFDSILKDE